MKVIVFEGIDGSGKSSCIEALRSHYQDEGKTVEVIKSPAILNSKFEPDEFLEMNDHVYFFLYLAQLQSIEQRIYKLKTEKKIDVLLLDRFYDSTFVYSKLLKLNKSKKKSYTKILYKYYYASLKPDVVVYCTAPIQIVLERIKARGESHKTYDLKFSNKLFMERASKDEDSTKKMILICTTEIKETLRALVEALNSLEVTNDTSKRQ
jgi:dTMP kinase